MDVITNIDLDLKKVHKGKVRDTFSFNDNLFIVASDRLSAFDVVFNEGIPYKGAVLNSLSIFWFNRTKNIIKNHFISDSIPVSLPKYLENRSMVVTSAIPIKLECVVRGYLTGSAYKEYKSNGKICGAVLPAGLENGDELHEPIFTPSTKADSGHDENISYETAASIVGKEVVRHIKQKSIELYNFGKQHARKCGLVLADTKFEFGFVGNNDIENIILIDECLTPDSSRYWLKDEYENGNLVSMDKQFVRDYLEKS